MFVVRSALHYFINEVLSFRPWPHNAHIAYQYIVKLGQFIKPGSAHELPEPGDARVIFPRKLGAVAFRVLIHRTELMDHERVAMPADALMAVNDFSGRI